MVIEEFNYQPLPIDFKEDKHTYTLDGIPLIGTTTVIKCKAKDFLKFWTVKLMYQILQKEWNIKKVYTEEEKETLLVSAKNAHAQKKDKASDSGKIAHALIQKSIEENKRFKVGEKQIDSVSKEVINIYNSWLAWEEKHKIKYLATELIVGSKELWTGGTIDCIAMVDGDLELLDWKSSSQLSNDVSIQTAGYKFMLLEGGVSPDIKRRTIRLSKTKVEFEDKLIRTPYEKDLECFKALLTIYRWERDIDKTKMVKGN